MLKEDYFGEVFTSALCAHGCEFKSAIASALQVHSFLDLWGSLFELQSSYPQYGALMGV